MLRRLAVAHLPLTELIGYASSSHPSTPPASTAADARKADSAVDSKVAEQIKLADEIGENAFEKNTGILKQLAMRGLRAFVVCMAGLAAFSLTLKRKKRLLESEEQLTETASADAAVDLEDPTQRYLEEMRGLGFDVDTLEEELQIERQVKRQRSGL